MAAHKLVNMIDPSRSKLVFELLANDVVNVAIAQAVERCAHYATLDPNSVPAPVKKSKRYGITITAPNGKEFETVRVTPQLLATAFSETYRSLRAPMQCKSQHDFLFHMQGLNIVDTDTKRYTLAVDGNRFILKVTGTPLTEALAKVTPRGKPAVAAEVALPTIVRNEVGDLTPATRRAFRDVWNSMLNDAKEPLAVISENCLLKTPRYLANVTRVEVLFGKGRDTKQFDLAYVAKGAAEGSDPRTMGKWFPMTAQGIANALHSLRIRCPLPVGNIAAKPPKADAKKKTPVHLGAGTPIVTKKPEAEAKPLPKAETKKPSKPAPKSAKPAPKKPEAKPAPKKPEAKPAPAPFTTDRDSTGATASTPKNDA